jgi:bifunctional UDP-N-acetylglucosamine pyrophosphorylase/glucosamine-1-phosphate N-acetyltransferase
MTQPLNPRASGPRTAKPRVAVVMAAGKGTRMRSERPKVLFEAAGRPLLAWVIDAARQAGCERILVIVGHGADQVRAAFADQPDLEWIVQAQQLGTGHAVLQAAGAVPDGTLVLVLSGDVPLVRAETLDRLARAAEAEGGWGAASVADHAPPSSLGRVITSGDRLVRIVEVRDASPAEVAIRTVNVGLYALPAPELFGYLRQLRPNNAQGELYLTDAVGLAAAEHRHVAAVPLDDPREGLGVNDRRELATVHRLLIDRHLDQLMRDGVSILEPARTSIEPSVRVGRDTVIHPEVSLFGHTSIGANCVVHQGCWVRDSQVDDAVTLDPYSILDQAEVATECTVGPFARLRPASVLLRGARVGNFVELKKTRLGAGAKASHLTYLGDADVGDDANIGAGVVTCNYDGVRKNETKIGARAFIGSDTMLVAPVEIGSGATTAAGSTITQDVPDGALAVGRARQRNIDGWAQRKR